MQGRGLKPQKDRGPHRSPGSPLMQGRGLKQDLEEVKRKQLVVAPHAGAWIETVCGGPDAAQRSRPSCRGVD
jgi:hypothetical protein